jgi:centrosomal protein CEP41
MLGITSDTKFILLDLREEDEYKEWHIKEAINFPAPNICRDKVFSSLLRFKNKADKLIVVYMTDERMGTQYTKILFEKGFDNVYLLSGGIEKFLILYPELVEGNKVPVVEKGKDKENLKKKSGVKGGT